ncbi:MAG: 4-(cytidine 5'-diphospho)-2-C-methyl-D-erythritol kinase [Lachnospiraceae bacterium]|nr:4-(cytidine 5'-diphospho)-2-C-methyl-D-erythritol kinase [Lachnospiraceae bacterium]
MRVLAHGKINLTLNVLGRRPDGYHDLELIFQPVSLADELEIRENGTNELRFSCSVPEFAGEDNLVCRGYRRMREQFSEKVRGLTVHLTKQIPSGAGMAGGSADCAALLLWMNEHFALGLGQQELTEIGVSLGADVPACMMTHATLGRGVGEILTDIGIHRDYPLLLLKPEVSFNTGAMFRALDAAGYERQRYTSAGMIEAMEADDLTAMCGHLYNVFEEAVPERALIQGLKAQLMEAGALGSLMTGSGSVVYGIFADAEARDRAFETLRGLKNVRVYACEAINRWEEV